MKHFLLIAICLFFVHTTAADETTLFLKTHCIRCHGAQKPKGDLRLDNLPRASADADDLEIWQAIIDRVDANEMPPEKAPQPSGEQRARFLTSLREQIAAKAAAGSKQVVLRRLNRAQFRNSLRDLLHIDVDVEDPTEAFPADDQEDGFDNLGEVLQMSDFLMRQYLKVARAAVDRATFDGPQPEPQTYTLRDKKTRPLNFKVSGNDSARDYVVLYLNDERAPGDPRGQQFINCREGATHDGWYEFTFEVESKGRGNLAKELRVQKRDDYQVYRAEDLHRFEIYLTAPRAKSQIQTRPRRLVVSLDLPDNQRQTIKRRFWLPQGWRVEAGFGNGYGTSSSTALLKILDPDFDLDAFEQLDRREQRGQIGKLTIDRLEQRDAPRIVVHNVTETGPHYDQWPPASHTAVYGQPGQSIEQHLTAFAARAFRRPVTPKQMAPYVRLAQRSPEGIRTAIEALLCSPRFIYLQETSQQLDDYALASRLSYFLWNTMPDEALFVDAEKGRLSDSAVLSRHIDRMIADPRSNEFIRSFVWAWLKLQNTVEMAPDPMKFYEYHRNRLGDAMVEETRLFFRHLLTENLPISNFLDSDFTFVNSDLVRHYDLPAKIDTSARFQKVALSVGHRGGLLGQASVLTASANGVDTSPVTRGIWILDNLLGTPPSPPPPDVDIPEPDARGELTIRELYAKHRTVESCNDCHKKIDPLGFSLENYDAIGAWRNRYDSGHAIDSSGRTPSGETFQDAAGLKRIMVRDLRLFSRNLTAKLMTYAAGRTMTVADRAEIDAIAKRLEADRVGLRDLVKLVVSSKTFRTK